MLKRKIYSSWLVALLAACFVCGVVVAGYMKSDVFTSPLIAVVSVIVIIFGLWKRRVYVVLLLIVAGVLLGLWRGGLVQVELSPYKRLIGHLATVRGVVSEDPELDEKGELIVRLGVVAIEDRDMTGMIWVSALGERDVKRGDTIEVRGKLEEGFGTFAASMFFARIQRVTRPVPGDVAGRVREWFSEQVTKVIASPESALGIGFLTGQRNVLSAELDDALRVAGLTHIVVASGYNLTILVRVARRLFTQVSKYLAALSAGAMITGFMAITGLSPSMSRAGLVAGLCLLAWYYGRKFHPLVLLPLVAAVTLAVNPSFAWGDLGWQLSFAAFVGVMIMAPLLQAYFFGDKKPGMIRQIAGETIAAQLVTLPILLVAFGQVSAVALIANLLIVPLIPLVMLLVFSAGIFAALFHPLGSLLGSIAQVLLSCMIGVANWCASLPWALVQLTTPWWVAGLIYGGMITLCVVMWRVTGYNLRQANVVE